MNPNFYFVDTSAHDDFYVFCKLFKISFTAVAASKDTRRGGTIKLP